MTLRRGEFRPEELNLRFNFFQKIQHTPSVVLEWRMKNIVESRIFSEIFRLERLFLLIGRGSVQTTPYILYLKKGEEKWHEFSLSHSFHTMQAIYEIDNRGIQKLKSSIDILLPKLCKILATNNPPKEGHPSLNALIRYRDSIVTHLGLNDTFIFGINCLEALFLKTEERTELQYRVVNRVALLLSHFGHSSLEIKRELEKAYSARNKVAHGGRLTQNSINKLAPINESLQNYARLSIQIYLQLMGSIPKEDLIDKIDDSLIDNDSNEKLRSDLIKLGITTINFQKKV